MGGDKRLTKSQERALYLAEVYASGYRMGYNGIKAGGSPYHKKAMQYPKWLEGRDKGERRREREVHRMFTGKVDVLSDDIVEWV